jgi:hypothetical protein
MLSYEPVCFLYALIGLAADRLLLPSLKERDGQMNREWRVAETQLSSLTSQ